MKAEFHSLGKKTMWAFLAFLQFAFPAMAAPPDHVLSPSGSETQVRDFVFDTRRNRLYATTDQGFLERYDFNTSSMMPPLNFGGSLYGLDIDPTHSFLIIAQGTAGSTTGVFYRLDLETNMSTSLPYDLDSDEGGGFDVAIMANGKAIISTQYQGSGWVPLREIDLATNTVTERTDLPDDADDVRQNTLLNQSGDRKVLYLQESNSSAGPTFRYYADTDEFRDQQDTGAFNRRGATNSNGTLFATHSYPNSYVEDSDFGLVRAFSGYVSGFAFDHYGDRFFICNEAEDQIEIYSTGNWLNPPLVIPVDSGISYESSQFSEGHLRTTPEGDKIAVLISDGFFGPSWVEVFNLNGPAGARAPSLNIEGGSASNSVLLVPETTREIPWDLYGSPDMVNWGLVMRAFGSSQIEVQRPKGVGGYFWRSESS